MGDVLASEKICVLVLLTACLRAVWWSSTRSFVLYMDMDMLFV